MSSVDAVTAARREGLAFGITSLLGKDKDSRALATKNLDDHSPTTYHHHLQAACYLPTLLFPSPTAKSFLLPPPFNCLTDANASPNLQKSFVQSPPGQQSIPKRLGHPYQSRVPAKHKKPRTSFTKPQIGLLEARFANQKYLASGERAELARQLRMSDAQVKTW